jgi:hypothetical protein
MADPIVHLTNGIPDATSGSGNVTTLGITIPPAATTTSSVQGGPMCQGAVTTSVPSYTTGQVNALSLTTTGLLRIDGSGVTQPVSGTFWQTTQPVSGTFWQTTQPISGTITANQGGAPWTATIQQGGNSAVVKAASTAAAAADPALVVAVSPNNTVGVTGTFWQTTQPVSGTVTAAQTTAANLLCTASQGGIWTVQPGNTANTTPWLTTARIVGNTGSVIDALSSQNVATPASMILTGGEYNTTPTAITSGNSSPLQVDTRGRLLSVNSLRANKGVQYTTIATATETTVVTAGTAGVFQDVYAIVVTNTSATATFVDFRDSTAGTIRLSLAAPAGDTRGFTVTADSAMVQATAANNWTATVSGGAVSTIEITMLFVSNVA